MVGRREEEIIQTEEEYFFRVNQELIANQRLVHRRQQRQLMEDEKARRRLERVAARACPGCGDELESVDLIGLCAERCPSCAGVFFSQPELERLIRLLRHT